MSTRKGKKKNGKKKLTWTLALSITSSAILLFSFAPIFHFPLPRARSPVPVLVTSAYSLRSKGIIDIYIELA